MDDLFNLVVEAQKRLVGHAHVTPVMTSQTLDDRTGARVFFKCENFQRMGAFKFRGAYNAMSQLTKEQKDRGVITYSSGNHAQATALVGRLLGIRHPNLARVFDLRQDTVGHLYIITEYIDGTSVETLIGRLKERQKRLPVALALSAFFSS